MTAGEVCSALQNRLPEIKIELQHGQVGDPWILVQPADLLTVIQILKQDLGLNYLACLSAIDYDTNLGVVYQLRSLSVKFEIMVKILTPKNNPLVPSLTNLYPAASWFEREAYDLLGVNFQDHPDLRRIIMPEDWVGHPLRKDYQAPAEYHGIPCDRPDTHQLLEQFHVTQRPDKVDTAGTFAAGKTPTGNTDNPGSKSPAE
jgi:NADH-quinone oxidoreductase subunit C